MTFLLFSETYEEAKKLEKSKEVETDVAEELVIDAKRRRIHPVKYREELQLNSSAHENDTMVQQIIQRSGIQFGADLQSSDQNLQHTITQEGQNFQVAFIQTSSFSDQIANPPVKLPMPMSSNSTIYSQPVAQDQRNILYLNSVPDQPMNTPNWVNELKQFVTDENKKLLDNMSSIITNSHVENQKNFE